MNVRLCDSHCHLDFSVFDSQRQTIMRQAVEAGVEVIVVPGVRAAGWDGLIELCRSHGQLTSDTPRLLPALGMHPCFMADHRQQHLVRLEQLLQQQLPVALGELGLDFWSPDAEREPQLELLQQQLDLASSYRLPLLLHARKCHDPLIQLLRRQRFEFGGIVHAFSGSRQQAEQYLSMGFKLGIGGAVTYPRAQRLRRTVKELGPEAWVLETDAPDMPLCGRQGQLNRPDYLPGVLQVMGELLQQPAAVLAQQFWSNTLAVLPRLES
ncbi:TatD family deoxyribonuclease [Motiliproteus coralliicola]|uniref:TatD family deoxyribonuclease n=1 Tax=Motiliproteus coralliicola TaxID=2283196 RepID=A0A369WNP8_9GAMM|nr:TatD family hydrolase [Motiliproteus coralliicola]RDE22689.1 TatD family deoxyribonuclease [Motiliproteus coralliicola]